MALGTYAGGWRIIRTTGMRIIKMNPAQGFATQGAGAAVILAASHFGFPISTTHVINGGVMGAGAAERVSAVRWGVAGNIMVAWVLTLPAAGLAGAAVYGITQIFGHGAAGPLVVLIAGIAVLVAAGFRVVAVRRLEAAR
jgi:PiT family inorganic phosphate transporter